MGRNSRRNRKARWAAVVNTEPDKGSATTCDWWVELTTPTPPPPKSSQPTAAESTTWGATTRSPVGGFCLYSMKLPFLQDALIPNETTKRRNYAALYAKMRSFQEKSDRTAQCYIAYPFGSTKASGRFSCLDHGFTYPGRNEKPYPIDLDAIRMSKDGLTLSGAMNMSDLDFLSTHGVFEMGAVPVWNGGLGGRAIYEGYVEFAVKYGMNVSKDYGRGTNASFRFWAIRSQDGDTLDPLG